MKLLTPGAPDFVAYRDGLGPWQTLPPASEHEICVATDYQVVVVCVPVAGVFRRHEWATTLAEADEILDGCDTGTVTPSERVTVSGMVVQPAAVWLGTQSLSSDAGPWAYALDIEKGTHDLVISDAYDKEGRAFIRRGLSVSKAIDVGTIDLDASATALVPTQFVLNGLLVDEAVRSSLAWRTSNMDPALGGAVVSTSLTTELQAVPGSLLGSKDEQIITASTFLRGNPQSNGNDIQRLAGWRFSGGARTVDLLPVITDIDVTAESVIWSSLPTHFSTVSYYVLSEPDLVLGVVGTMEITASSGWLELHGGNQLVIDRDIPGYDQSWEIDIRNGYHAIFGMTVSSPDLTLGTSVAVNVNTSTRLSPGHRVRRGFAAPFSDP